MSTRRAPAPLSRRQFLARSSAIGWLATAAGLGSATLGFLWPSVPSLGPGGRVDAGALDDVLADLDATGEPFAVPTARAYLVRYDAAEDPSGAYAALTAGAPVMALSQKCVHLGCRVPWCASAAWFECPCHNSKYNRWGEWQDGPAPRGMDRHALEVADGRVLVDVATLVTGPGRGGGVLIQPPEGAHCTARG